MKLYKDGDWVVYFNKKSEWHLMQFKAYNSTHTPGSYRLKYGEREVLADISELRSINNIANLLGDQYEELNKDISGNIRKSEYSTIHCPIVHKVPFL